MHPHLLASSLRRTDNPSSYTRQKACPRPGFGQAFWASIRSWVVTARTVTAFAVCRIPKFAPSPSVRRVASYMEELSRGSITNHIESRPTDPAPRAGYPGELAILDKPFAKVSLLAVSISPTDARYASPIKAVQFLKTAGLLTWNSIAVQPPHGESRSLWGKCSHFFCFLRRALCLFALMERL